MSYWINAKGFPGYEVSNDGYVRNKYTKQILKPYLNKPGGYYRVDINGQHAYVHQIVASSFYVNYKKGKRIKHIDKDKLNNDWRNLDFKR